MKCQGVSKVVRIQPVGTIGCDQISRKSSTFDCCQSISVEVIVQDFTMYVNVGCFHMMLMNSLRGREFCLSIAVYYSFKSGVSADIPTLVHR